MPPGFEQWYSQGIQRALKGLAKGLKSLYDLKQGKGSGLNLLLFEVFTGVYQCNYLERLQNT